MDIGGVLMKWEFKVKWRQKRKGGFGGCLPGTYSYSEAKMFTKRLRKRCPKHIFWMSNTKSQANDYENRK
jgi:hypothetical protein